jgi:predicted ArsR family transcriptional regulator
VVSTLPVDGIQETVMDGTDLDEAIDQLCVLHDPVRRSVYRTVREAEHALTRVEVAERAGVSVRLATFHLEKLVEEGFLEPTLARPGGSASVGRPAKRYAPTQLELEVTIPPRHYDVVAGILAAALGSSAEAGERMADAAAAAADYGQRIGRRVRRQRRIEDRIRVALRLAGYEPRHMNGDVVLTNCPFYRAAEAHSEVVCPMNHALVGGVLNGLRNRSYVPVLAREPGRCCVVLRPALSEADHS